MSEDTADLTITLKAGTTFDSPWIVVRGSNPDEVVNKLKGLDGVIEATLEAAGLFTAQRLGTQTSDPTPAPAQQAAPAWGSSPAAAQQTQQQAAPRPTGNHPSAQLHPEGKACDICPNVLEFKKTQSGKAKWQCPEWRWNNGNPNGHGMEWIA